jgi:dihydroxyacid dehydratase/phosphogluconate dehydratase
VPSFAPLTSPYQQQGGLVALFGSLAPNGAILKRSAADPRLFESEGRAVVFTSLEDLSVRIDDPDLDVTREDFLVLQNIGPKSAYAMPEAGYLPIPARLARAGVKDMVRISDGRMSGTTFAPSHCMSPRKPPSAGRWPSCAPATASG